MSMVFYEIEHGIGTNHFLYERNTDHSFPLHMHRCYEMVLMLDGEMKMQIDKDEYVLHPGDLILVRPYRAHSYATEPGRGGTSLLCVFSDDLIAAVSGALSKYNLRSVLLHDIPPLYRELFIQMQGKSDLASVKGFLYTLCSLFCHEIDYTREDAFSGNNQLLRDIFIFIENHVDQACTLHELARELRYNESYLSRMFLKSVGISYSEYVRNIKMEHACYLLRNTDENVFNIATKCGYTSHSSFNRSFKQLMGITPQEYRVGDSAGGSEVSSITK